MVGVAYDADVLVPLGEHVGEDVLRAVGVLVLVDEDVGEALLHLLEDGGMIAEGLHGAEEEVVEIEGVAGGEELLILLVNPGDGFGVKIAR